jgi:BirA family biotin operon repressor/biotin-[acetyl-CoA-carboxylase] ligase
VVLGVGVNVDQSAEELPAEAAKPPTSLRIETGRAWPRAELLAALLLELERGYDAWQQLHTNR